MKKNHNFKKFSTADKEFMVSMLIRVANDEHLQFTIEDILNEMIETGMIKKVERELWRLKLDNLESKIKDPAIE